MALVYHVYATYMDPDDPDHFGHYGHRASLRGAQTLAEKALKREIRGFHARGRSMGKDILETIANRPGDRRVRIVYDYR